MNDLDEQQSSSNLSQTEHQKSCKYFLKFGFEDLNIFSIPIQVEERKRIEKEKRRT